jgi:hypothetical protein
MTRVTVRAVGYQLKKLMLPNKNTKEGIRCFKTSCTSYLQNYILASSTTLQLRQSEECVSHRARNPVTVTTLKAMLAQTAFYGIPLCKWFVGFSAPMKAFANQCAARASRSASHVDLLHFDKQRWHASVGRFRRRRHEHRRCKRATTSLTFFSARALRNAAFDL